MNRVFVTGDTHGDDDIGKLKGNAFPQSATLAKDDYLIVAGDFGGVFFGTLDNKTDLYDVPSKLRPFIGADYYLLKWYEERNYTTLFVDGNHENHALLDSYPVEIWNGGKVHKINSSVYHLMRGQVFNIGDIKIFTMGGASSIDKQYRDENISWWSRELPSKEEYAEAKKNLDRNNNVVDYVITHCASTQITKAINEDKIIDELTDFLDFIEKEVKYKHWYFGHYHGNRVIDSKHTMLYEKIIEIT